MRFNNNTFMSIALRKAIMCSSKFKYICNKYRTEENWANYKKQRNFCVNLLRKTKAEYFQKLNVKDLSDNRKFWKTIKSFFSNKSLNSKKLMLKEQPTYCRGKRVSQCNEYLFSKHNREFGYKEG